MSDLVRMGAVTLEEESKAPQVQCMREIGDGEFEPFGQQELFGALGLTALPAPEDDDGAAEAVAMPVDGTDGTVLASRDTRAGEVYGALKPGETAVHSTGKGFDSRLLLKNQNASIIVGNDMVFTMDRDSKRIMAQVGKNQVNINEDGITLNAGGAAIIMQGGSIYLNGNLVLGGLSPNPATPVTGGPGGAVNTPSTKVFLAP